ncbi:MAG: nitrile hydratase subunit beta [Rhodospirillaceae bacterium]|jgi:nitrile hydratase subunit beta|nr:nitrile hydratase subunit beta [Rhodospirillaceae bacterium]MBT5244563.1 nitrile hydratase subunit beta [Rhodospirillaceae bacterium]MBT5563473.1 nitrile hydratase subunit beta [Rhodospirillaceae bacterium]MBT6240796.1 nitrile hydratase subunit beta [Rhodospirillaceae bacterium]MBT7137802.1 nitrile hydratase subunit beta [Rhodospirillaceae bacterium]
MNGPHDMGGVAGFGPINAEPEREEPLFHADWEKRAWVITLACGMLGRWTLDMSRHARERQEPERYLANSYFETWMAGLETLLLESGLITAGELKSGKSLDIPAPVAVDAGRAWEILATGGPTLMDEPIEPRFKVGQQVLAKDNQPQGHTRAPRYVRGHVGCVEAYRGVHVFADANALRPEDGGGRRGEPLYTVRFAARELWGQDASAHDSVLVDLWQPYLEGQ